MIAFWRIMRAISRSALLLPVVAGGLLAAGCGVSAGSTKIDHQKAEKLLLHGITGGTVKPKSVSCPKGVEVKKGGTFACVVTYADGAKADVTVHMTSDEGDVTVSPTDLHVR
jgi:hypothetical protein